MAENSLKVRLQHAVIGEGSTTTSSVPKKGEIIFNSTLDNCRVGNGSRPYNELSDFLKNDSSKLVWYHSSGQNTVLESEINSILYSSSFEIDTYNHIMIDAASLKSNPTWLVNGVRHYPLSTRLLSYTGQSVYSYLRNHPYKTLKISVFSRASTNDDKMMGFFYFSTSDSTWQLAGLRWCTLGTKYENYTSEVIDNTQTGGDNTYYSIACKAVSSSFLNNMHLFGATFCITCVDVNNNIFLIE